MLTQTMTMRVYSDQTFQQLQRNVSKFYRDVTVN